GARGQREDDGALGLGAGRAAMVLPRRGRGLLGRRGGRVTRRGDCPPGSTSSRCRDGDAPRRGGRRWSLGRLGAPVRARLAPPEAGGARSAVRRITGRRTFDAKTAQSRDGFLDSVTPGTPGCPWGPLGQRSADETSVGRVGLGRSRGPGAPGRRRSPGQDLDDIAVTQDVSASDLLAVEPGGRSADARPARAGAEVVVYPVGKVCDRRTGGQGERLVVTTPVAFRKHADQAGQLPDRLAETVQARVVEYRHVDRVVVDQALESLAELVGLRAHQDRALLDPGRSD